MAMKPEPCWTRSRLSGTSCSRRRNGVSDCVLRMAHGHQGSASARNQVPGEQVGGAEGYNPDRHGPAEQQPRDGAHGAVTAQDDHPPGAGIQVREEGRTLLGVGCHRRKGQSDAGESSVLQMLRELDRQGVAVAVGLAGTSVGNNDGRGGHDGRGRRQRAGKVCRRAARFSAHGLGLAAGLARRLPAPADGG